MKNQILILSLFLSILFMRDEISIEIITTNDLHGNIAPQKAWFMNPGFPPDISGGAALLNYVKENRKESDLEILVFDAGNFFQGHPYGMNDGGLKMIEWMNQLEYTALVPGENDFVLGQENLNKLADKAKFPFLMTNLICDDCKLLSDNIKPYIIKDIGDVKIGILGIVNSAIEGLVPSEKIKGIKLENSIKSIEKGVSLLKEKKVNSIIVLTSSGVPWDRDEKYDEFEEKLENQSIDPYLMDLNSIELGRFSNGVDVIVSGGISKGYNLPWYDPYSHVYIFQNYGNGTGFGHFKIDFDSSTKIFKGYQTMVDGKVGQTLLSDDFDSDADEYSKIEEHNTKVIADLYKPLNLKESPLQSINNIIQKKTNYDQWDIPQLGTDLTLEVMTWNCEFFPAAGDSTIKAMSEVISDIDVDIIAFQEIKKVAWFEKLVSNLPNYNYIVSKNSSFMDQAYIYKKNLFEFIREKEPFSDNDYNFAGRPPLRLDLLLTYNNLNIPISLLNLHMKCCDSGLKRRKNASRMLYNYIENEINNFSFSNFIVLGDWNDDLNDNPGEHCFDPFLNDQKYYFLTSSIDDDPNMATYPKEPYVSFLDHILTLSNFIDSKDVLVETVMVEDHLGGYEIYEQLISDHRPVLMTIPFDKIKIDFKLNELMYNELTGEKQVSVLYNQMNVVLEKGDKLLNSEVVDINKNYILLQTDSKIDTLKFQ